MKFLNWITFGLLSFSLQAESLPRDLPRKVDHRAIYSELVYGLESQGRRPSCAIFAVVNALEFDHFNANGEKLQLSEDYVLYHTYLGRSEDSAEPVPKNGGNDLGFYLEDVFKAIRENGICTRQLMPTTVGGTSELAEPTRAAIQDASTRKTLFFEKLSGRTKEEVLLKAMHAISNKKAIILSTAWPHAPGLRRAVLIDSQEPGPTGHAVSLVGYISDTGKLADTKFIFRNSWGRHWGVNGFGFISYAYLRRNMHAIVEVSARPLQ